MSALRYVVLHHTGIDQPHYDLMFERQPGSMLATVRCSNWPPASATIFERIADHRTSYLDYEGAVSRNRGEVTRVESGTCTVEVDENAVLLTLSSGAQFRVPGLWQK
jgi:hypothetical protein